MTAVAVKQENPVAIVRNELEKMSTQFEAALPKQIPVERFKRVVMTAIQQNPDLLNCEPRSLWNSAMRAAQDGLLPDGREGAMVPFKGRVQWIPMVSGIRKKVRNSGEILSWDAHVVHAKDEFEYELGDDPFIKHKPYMSKDGKDDPGPVIAAYSVATLKGGEKSREVMTVGQIERIRMKAPGGNSDAWKNHYDEMCRKTVARRHAKVLPMSTDLDDLIRRDDEIMDVKEEVRERQRIERVSGASALDVFAGTVKTEDGTVADAETGEILEEQKPAKELGSADAYARGQEARRQTIPIMAPPTEWRETTHKSLIEAWQAGWDAADEELKEAKK